MKTILHPSLLLQKIILRIISSAVCYKENTDHRFIKHDILTIGNEHKLQLVKFVQTQLKSHTVSSLPLVSDIHNRNLRNKELLRSPQTHTDACMRFVSYSGCLVWNSGDLHLENIHKVIPSKCCY